ncbi:2-amino-4-hydroxy-6-hydroxymethyldihydropteridine diphosphokinase [Bacillus cereus]
MNNIAYIALGSNIGERYTYLTEAIQFLNKNPYIKVEDVSSVYETEPVGYTDQSCFFKFSYKNFYQFITARIIESNAKSRK